MSKHSAVDWTLKGDSAVIASVVHPSAIDVGSVLIDVKFKGVNCKIEFIRYPPLKTTSLGKHVALELTTNPSVVTSYSTIGPTSL